MTQAHFLSAAAPEDDMTAPLPLGVCVAIWVGASLMLWSLIFAVFRLL